MKMNQAHQIILAITIFMVISLVIISTQMSFGNSTQPTFQISESQDPPNTFASGEWANYPTEQTLLEHVQELIEEQSRYSLQIMAVGDIMLHKNQLQAGRTGDGYDFNPTFTYIKPILEKADLLLGNLETTMAGPQRGYGGYPSFNSPDQLAQALREAGFDLMTTANNHSLDRGEAGVIRTLDILDQEGLLHTGTSRSPAERDQITILKKNGIKVAILAYTFGTNGLTVPEGKEYLVNYINTDQMTADVEQAKTQGADLITVALHFGEEYQSEPNRSQVLLADYLFSQGVDLVLGSHPHVLQQYQSRRWQTKTGEERTGVVVYSLGNFISDQRTNPRDIGGILSVHVVKEGGKVRIEEVDLIPTYMHRYYSEQQLVYHVLPMSEVAEDQLFPGLQDTDYSVLKKRYQSTLQHITQKTQFSAIPIRDEIYIVRPGDTLYKVALDHDTTIAQLHKANPGINPNSLRVGEVLGIVREEQQH